MRLNTTADELASVFRAAGIREITLEEERREHQRLGHCPAQPCPIHGLAFYAGRQLGPWEWEMA